MVRVVLLVMTAGSLAGCATEADQPAAQLAIPGDDAATPNGVHCSAIARERANDALANGYGFRIEESVFREAYEDCMAWRSGKPA